MDNMDSSQVQKEQVRQQLRQAALEYHEFPTPGKISVTPTKQLTNQRDLALAYSPGVAAACEEIVLRLTRALQQKTGERNLCLAGGVALNCVANGKVRREGAFENIWIQPAAGDAGGAVGAALAAYHLHFKNPRTAAHADQMSGAFLGPQFSNDEIARVLRGIGAKFEILPDDELFKRAVAALAEGQALGWHQGRSEFGPRALGNRSILADPRSREMQKSLNLKVKFRESFRPFAPAVLEEDANRWFDFEGESPYMLFTADVAAAHRLPYKDENLFGIDKLNVPRSKIPAVTHVDNSARLQTVSKDTNPRFHRLIGEFKARTGCPVLVNTSFNVRGEPIVNSPEDAFRCFMGTDIESLAIGNCFLSKKDQDPALMRSYRDRFELD